MGRLLVEVPGIEATLDLDSGISEIRARGVITQRSCSNVLPLVTAAIDRYKPHALIEVMTETTLALPPSFFAQEARERIAEPDWFKRPGALVVHPDHLALWDEYCALQCSRGSSRAAFTDHESARRWAAQQAELFELQRRYLDRRRALMG